MIISFLKAIADLALADPSVQACSGQDVRDLLQALVQRAETVLACVPLDRGWPGLRSLPALAEATRLAIDVLGAEAALVHRVGAARPPCESVPISAAR